MVRNTGRAAYATAITGVNGSMKIESVTTNASGEMSQTIGILITSESPILCGVTAIAVPNPGSQVYGIRVSGGSPTIRDSSVSASDPTSSVNVYGIYANGRSAAVISNCTVLAIKHALRRCGERRQRGRTVEHSRLDPSSLGMATRGTSTMLVATSVVNGSLLSGETTHVRTLDHDRNLAPFTCP